MRKQPVLPPAELLDLGEHIDKLLRAALAKREYRIVRREDYDRHWMQRGPRDRSGYRMVRAKKSSEDECNAMNAASHVLGSVHAYPRHCLLCRIAFVETASENIGAAVVLQHCFQPSEYDINGELICAACAEPDPPEDSEAFNAEVAVAIARLYPVPSEALH
jgi:hypothetical protein